jgi:probable HAF family extracellular repeat protein
MSKTHRNVGVAVGVLGLCAIARSALAVPSFQALPTNFAGALSGDGTTAVGSMPTLICCNFEGGLYPVSQAFRWNASTGVQPLGWLFYPNEFAQGSSALDVNFDGSVLVGDSESTPPFAQAYRWTQATGMSSLAPFADSRSSATAVSSDGSVVAGTANNLLGTAESFRWTQATGIQSIGDLPGGAVFSDAKAVNGDGSVIAGIGTSASGTEAYRWTSAGGMQGLGDLAGGAFESFAFGISLDGSVIVGQSASASGREAFRWTEATGMVGLGDLPGGIFRSIASDISADGSVIVGSANSGVAQAVLWTETDGMRPIQDLLMNELGLDLTGWQLTDAFGISDDGLTILGRGTNPDGISASWIAVIPEPATGLLFLLGLAGLALPRRS